MVNNVHYDKMLEAAENKKRVHAACAAARQFLVEQSLVKNPFPPESKKTYGVAAVKHDRMSLKTRNKEANLHHSHAVSVLHPGGLLSSTTPSATLKASPPASGRQQGKVVNTRKGKSDEKGRRS